MKPTIMLTIAALCIHQHIKLEQICNGKMFAQKQCELLQEELMELDEMKLCPAVMEDSYSGKQS